MSGEIFSERDCLSLMFSHIWRRIRVRGKQKGSQVEYRALYMYSLGHINLVFASLSTELPPQSRLSSLGLSPLESLLAHTFAHTRTQTPPHRHSFPFPK